MRHCYLFPARSLYSIGSFFLKNLTRMPNDATGFAEVYDAHVQKIYAFVYYRVQHREIAEDLTSATFLKALDKYVSFKGGNVRAWLYRIARNTITDHYRTHRPPADLDAAQDVASTANPAHDAETRLQLQRVLAELRTLPNEQQEIVLMRAWDGLTHAEIAEILGKTEASVKMQFSRSVRQLQSKLPLAALLLFFTLRPYA